MNKGFFLFVGLFVSSAFASTEGLKVTYGIDVYHSNAPSNHLTGKYFIQEGAVRMEIESEDSPMGNTVILGKLNPKQSVMMLPKKKMYFEMTQTPEKMAKKVKEEKEFKPTGKTKNIAGYDCSVMSREIQGQKEEACTSSEFANALKNLEAVLPKNGDQKQALPKGLNGFPLEYKVVKKKTGKDAGQLDMLMQVEKISKEMFTAAIFDVPADYKKMEMPPLDYSKVNAPPQKGKEAQTPQNLEEKLKEMKKMIQENQNEKKPTGN